MLSESGPALTETGRRPRPIIEYRNVGFAYGGREVLEHFSLTVLESSTVALLGPSGCGKSTALNLAAGFLLPRVGTVVVGGEQNPRPGADRALVTQEDSVFPWLTVAENVAFGSRVSGGANSAEVQHWLKYVGLGRESTSYPRQLSGGMLQRVALARAWANRPAILLLDEPFRSLDWGTKLDLIHLVRDGAASQAQTVLFVTHDPDEAVSAADRIVVLNRKAKIVWDRLSPFLASSPVADRRMDPMFSAFRKEVEQQVIAASAIFQTGSSEP